MVRRAVIRMHRAARLDLGMCGHCRRGKRDGPEEQGQERRET